MTDGDYFSKIRCCLLLYTPLHDVKQCLFYVESGLKALALTFFVTDFLSRGHDLTHDDNEFIRAAHFSHSGIHFYLRSHQNHLRLVIITRWQSAAAHVNHMLPSGAGEAVDT